LGRAGLKRRSHPGTNSPGRDGTSRVSKWVQIASFSSPHESKLSMKAIQVTQTGGPDVLQLVDLPEPQSRPNEAVVKIAAAGVNFVDVYHREGRYKVPLPFVIGQEAAGLVTAVGKEVGALKPGDRVAWASVMGSYAEFAAVPADRLVKIPASLDDRQAAAAMLQGMTAQYLAYDTFPLKKGDTALIHAAAGGVGLLLVQMTHHLGVRILATVSTEEKARLAREAGADEIIFYTQQDFEAETKRLTNGRGVDVVYDSVGKTTFDKGLNVLRPRGMMVLYGGSSGAVAPFDPILLTQKGSLFLTRPSLGHYILTASELQGRASAVFDMIVSGKLKLRIEHTYPLAEAQRAHRDLEARKTTGKLLLIP
jgi:NADPH:quinone reductase